jgi:hypothetical protein
MMRKSSWILGAVPAIGLLGLLVSCGGKDDGGPTGPNPPVGALTATPTPAPAATATPQPTPPPTPAGPDEDANPGPVRSVFTRVFVVRDKQGGEQIPGKYGDQYPGTPYYDPAFDTERVPVGAFFILDTTPKNAAGQKCQADRPPDWVVNHGGKFEPLGNNGIGSNPFQYRANARSKGKVEVYTFVDGVRSNVITVDIY